MELERKTQTEFVIQTPEMSDDDVLKTEYHYDWNAMTAINSDVVGWIRFDNPARINYPIVKGDSNQYYLNHDWQKNYLVAGSIFMHKTNDREFADQNTILYGHRMRGGSMFGGITEYTSQEFLDNNPYFYVYTPDGKTRTYEIVAYAEVEDGSDAYLTRFKTGDERTAHYDFILKHAKTKRDVALTEYDTTMLLSSCASYGYYNRMVLLGKLISIETEE